MKLVVQTEHVAVYDDVLAEQDLVALRLHAAGEKYTTPLISSGWVKSWRPGDGQPFCSELYLAESEPLGNPLDLLTGAAHALASQHPNLITAYTELAYRFYLYPRGTRISWHDDRYAGALTFYLHPRWGATWGGELMVADMPRISEYLRENAASGRQEWLTPWWEEDYLSQKGTGLWIMPKPNRLVLTSAWAYHLVNRVDDDAGGNVRASVVGFYRNRRV